MEQTLKSWWQSLAQRERQMVAAAVVVIIIGVGYWGIWSPITNALSDAEQDLQVQQQNLLYAKTTANQITALRQSGQQSTRRGSISTIVTKAANDYQLEISRMQPQGNSIQLWMDDVPFNTLISFLDKLVQEQGLSLDSLDVSETDTPGIVQVRRIQLSQ
ncbi:type II secretion system protein M [Shewanella sp. NIFS-20-20]|uniref:type II secretion system protein M n=1 Tax=Shewanella sp. NIFS-20-20 TaxID=2853806 RepID=UPI001C457C8C|nr:type II secretion system protein M [Shewanella sp. NIFS-20-20]MBV7316701.1 type II secretion system protein M [Shewanella sp. NIFS-20-20]